MKVFKSLGELAKGLDVTAWEVEKAWENGWHRGNFFVAETNIIIHKSIGKKALYVQVDRKSDEECKEYFMKYEKDLYTFVVYVDDIEKEQECSIIDITNTKMNITRATVKIIKTGTQLNRRVKFILDKEDEDYKKDGCIYFWER